MKLLFSVLFMLLWLTGCQSFSWTYDTPKSLPPVGDVIRLNQALVVKPGSTRVYIQNGIPQDFKQIDIYQPWCQFFLHQHPEVMTKTRSIQPDQFSVIEAYNLMDTFIAGVSVVASADWIVADSSSIDVGSRALQSIMKLHSEKQPQVIELKCLIYDDPADVNYLSVNQMQQTLGNVVTISKK